MIKLICELLDRCLLPVLTDIVLEYKSLEWDIVTKDIHPSSGHCSLQLTNLSSFYEFVTHIRSDEHWLFAVHDDGSMSTLNSRGVYMRNKMCARTNNKRVRMHIESMGKLCQKSSLLIPLRDSLHLVTRRGIWTCMHSGRYWAPNKCMKLPGTYLTCDKWYLGRHVQSIIALVLIQGRKRLLVWRDDQGWEDCGICVDFDVYSITTLLDSQTQTSLWLATDVGILVYKQGRLENPPDRVYQINHVSSLVKLPCRRQVLLVAEDGCFRYNLVTDKLTRVLDGLSLIVENCIW